MLTRVPPKLSPELEAIVSKTIGSAIRVHKAMEQLVVVELKAVEQLHPVHNANAFLHERRQATRWTLDELQLNVVEGTHPSLRVVKASSCVSSYFVSFVLFRVLRGCVVLGT